ncbi:glycosyltransferase [Cellulomonas hominis]|uniref:glycosyltransferase n=1 Tax=Cellulomonas hominis TaxID=156981 RepID=UPI001BD08A4C|nr:glycosyltransferase [Cellulomonas hominis]
MTAPERPAGGGRLAVARAGLWHLRRGGVAQVRRFRDRRRAGAAPPSRPERSPATPGLVVGVVADDHLHLALGHEWHVVVPSPTTAGAEGAGPPPLDLLVVGSSPSGAAHRWRDQLLGSSAPGAALAQLLDACRGTGTPTVLWDTDEREAPLVGAAASFDRVYAADATRAERYRRALGHARVGVLPPAVQPVLHSPARAAGGPGAGREHPVVLVPGQDGGPAAVRTVLEHSARGTVVVTGAAAAGPLEPGEVLRARDADEAALVLRGALNSPQLRDRTVHLAQRRIWREHTYGARARRVLADVGLREGDAARDPYVTALVSTHRAAQLEQILRTVASQRGVRVQLALLTHGFVAREHALRRRCRELGIEEVVLLTADRTVPLGACLNRLVAVADAPVVAKLDDDDLYGEHYLADQARALAYADADLVGKQAHHVHLRRSGATVLRFGDREHRYTDLVAGPTIVCRREVAAAARFPEVARGEDTGMLRRVVAAGGRVYSADRFNFVQVRSGRDAHTWQITDDEVLATGELLFFGPPQSHVLV